MDNAIQQTVPNILIKLAQLLGSEIKNRRLEIPERFGTGYCTGFIFGHQLQMLISNYELKEEIDVENPEVNFARRMIFFKFRNVFRSSEVMPSVLIGTSRVNTDDVISIHTNTATINIEVDAEYLKGLFRFSEQSPVLQSLLENSQPLLFEQMIYPSLQKTVDEIVNASITETFELFFQRIKAEELICRLLMELEKRDEKRLYSLNVRDIQAMYHVKEKILANLAIPPIINELAISAGMSSSKLKRLFKQIFGNSIFSYYQEFRMKEAARLLKEAKLSVSDVGYRLGFTNLSHFSRVFRGHIGIKPKQYSQH